MFPGPRSRPDKDSARKAWEASWTVDLAAFYAPQRPLSSYKRVIDGLPEALLSASASDSQVLQADRMAREICDLQTDLTQAAVRSFVSEGFEQAWRDAGAARREECVLEGLARACKAAEWMESKRGLCPEITLPALTADNGEGYLRLLRLLMPEVLPSQTTAIKEPVQVQHAAVDRILRLTQAESSKPGYRVVVRTMRLQRTYFVTMVAWNIFLAFVSS